MRDADRCDVSYAARCNQLMVTPSEPLIILVENLAAEGNRTLNLSKCPGVLELDLRPLTLTLLHNVYFTGNATMRHKRSLIDLVFAR